MQHRFELIPLPKEPFVSIIVPFHWGLKPENYKRFIQDFKSYLNIDYKKYEIVLVTDKPAKVPFTSKKIVYLVTNSDHPTSPSEKRDFAMKRARGEICAYIDDDAYPRKDWLKNAVRHFQHPEIVSVGGPGVTPPKDDYWQKVGGSILESYFCSGKLLFRYRPVGGWAVVDDYPAYNLFVRTDILKKVGGYNSTYYYGEDTKICIDLIKYGKILYDPGVLVYHHRRSFPKHHFIQIWKTGVHRGFFVKAFPETSKRLIYFLPLAMTVGFFSLSLMSIFKPAIFAVPTILLLMGVWLLGFYSLIKRGKDIQTSMIGGLGIIMTHMAYAIGFVKGLSTRNLVR